jgi:uncharacterized protein
LNMWKLLTAALVAAPLAMAAPLDAAPQTRLADDLRCHLGAYALHKGDAIVMTGAGGAPRELTYTLSSGAFARVAEGAGGIFTAGPTAITFAPCAAGKITLTTEAGVQTGKRVALITRETTFMSDGLKLHGKLVMPARGRAQALAVWVEGSNNNPSTDDTVWQYELARRGIGVFVYDKRGTGASGGALSADVFARARDTAAAVAQAKRLAPHVRRVGVIGGSQGGWVAPLAATFTPLDFVIPAFALAESPIAQDQALVQWQLRHAGFDAQAQAAARELTAITARIVVGNADADFAELDAFKAKHAGAPWLKAIQPRSFTGLFLMFSTEQIKAAGPAMAQGLRFDYDPRPVIETIAPRQLWLLAGADTQAPNAQTQVILREIQMKRDDLSVVVFARADHGLIETTQTANGPALAYSAGLFDVTADWIKANKLPGQGRFINRP